MLHIGLLATIAISGPFAGAHVTQAGVRACEAYLSKDNPRAHSSPVSVDLALQIEQAAVYLPDAEHTALGNFVSIAFARDPIHGSDFDQRSRAWKKHKKALAFRPAPNFRESNQAELIQRYSWFGEPSARRILRCMGCGYPELAAPRFEDLDGLANHLASMQTASGRTEVTREVLFAILAAYARNESEPWIRETMIDVWGLFRGKVPDFRRYPTVPESRRGNLHGNVPVKEVDSFLNLLVAVERNSNFVGRPLQWFADLKNPFFALTLSQQKKVESFLARLEGVRDKWLDQVAIRSGIPKADFVDHRPHAAPPSPATRSAIPRRPIPNGTDPVLDDLEADILRDVVPEVAPEPAPVAPAAPPATMFDVVRAIDDVRKALDPLAREYLSETATPVPIVEKRPGSWSRVTAYIAAANQKLIEREHFLELARTTFLLDGSMLMLGPPGTAKSMGADVLGRHLVDENGQSSYFSQQLTQDTLISETSGGIIVDKAVTGETIRNWMAGAWGFKFVFLDEVFDGRLKFIGPFLSSFAGREYVQGHVRETAKTRILIGATNKYIDQIYRDALTEDPNSDISGLIDAFNTIYLATGKFENLSSVLRLHEGGRVEQPVLDYTDLDDLQDNISRITMTARQELMAHLIFEDMKTRVRKREREENENAIQMRMRGEVPPIPYRSTRVFSPESLQRVYKRIRVMAFERAKAKGFDQVAVTDEDVFEALRQDLAMQGPPDSVVKRELASFPEEDERRQLETLQFERHAIWSAIETFQRDAYADRMKVEKIDRIFKSSGDLRAVIDWLRHTTDALEGLDLVKTLNSSHLTALASLRHMVDNHPEFRKLVTP